MTKEPIIEGLLANIEGIRALNPVGATSHQVRSTVVWMRDIRDNFVAAWQKLGLSPEPSVPAAVHTMPLPADASVIYFGGEEVPQQTNMHPHLVIAAGSDGKPITIFPSGVDFHMWGSNLPDLTMGPNPHEGRSVSLPDFWSGAVFIDEGMHISRNDVLEYAAYNLGAVHSETGRYQARNPDRLRALNNLRAMPPFHVRDNVEYLLLSIARDLTLSPDMDRFIAAARKLP